MTPGLIEYLFLTTEWLIKAGKRITAAGASARLGTLAPMYALQELGYDARTFSIRMDLRAGEKAVAAAKRVVFGEMFHDADGAGWDAYWRLLSALRNPREQAVFSIADDKFAETDFLEFYRQALPECLAVTTVSERLAQTIRTLTPRPVLVAPEPYEGARGTPHTVSARKPSGVLNWLARRVGMSSNIWRARLLWFGYPMNLPPLLAMLPALEEFSRRCALLLTCVTEPVAELAELLTSERTHESATLRVQFLPWSLPVMDSAMAACDIVLIPSDYRNPVTQAKSPNRLIAGLHAGRFVVAHPLPAYAEYEQFAWIGEDLCEGLRWALTHPDDALDRIVRGQAYIDGKHSPEAVARFWLDVFHPNHTA